MNKNQIFGVVLSAVAVLTTGCGGVEDLNSTQDEYGSLEQEVRNAYATCAFASIGDPSSRAFATLGGGAVLYNDGTASLGGQVSFNGRDKYAMNITSWTGIDSNGDGS